MLSVLFFPNSLTTTREKIAFATTVWSTVIWRDTSLLWWRKSFWSTKFTTEGLQSLIVNQATFNLLKTFTPRGSLWSTNQTNLSFSSFSASLSLLLFLSSTDKDCWAFYSQRIETAVNLVDSTLLLSGISSSLTRNGPSCREHRSRSTWNSTTFLHLWLFLIIPLLNQPEYWMLNLYLFVQC